MLVEHVANGRGRADLAVGSVHLYEQSSARAVARAPTPKIRYQRLCYSWEEGQIDHAAGLGPDDV